MDSLSLFRGKRVHILGVGGTLMGAFADLLKKNGIEVTGSDTNVYPPMSDVLKRAGIEVYTPFSPENLNRAKPDLVIVGNVIRKTNPEMLAAVEKNLPYESLPSALERFVLPQKHPIVICGTHGKTTTSSMMAWLLESLGEKPSFFVGGVIKNFPESFRITDGKYMVLEGDEYDTAYFDKVAKFTHYLPKDTILTSVEYDHADIYPDMKSLIRTFDKLAEITKDNFIVCAETEIPMRVAHRSEADVLSYGFGATCDARASHVEITPERSKFTFEFDRHRYPVILPTTGKHNILNATACLALIAKRGLSIEGAIDAFQKYDGVKRRQEVYSVKNGITFIDDFAHHPTAVKETIAAIKAKYPKSRLVACFEPRSATSRRKVFQSAYVESFLGADLIFVSKPFTPVTTPVPGEVPPELFSAEELLSDLKRSGKRASLLDLTDTGLDRFIKDLSPGDVVLVMSNGAFEGILPRTVAKL